MNRRALGYLCGIISAVSYGMNPLFGLHLYGEGLTPLSVLFYRFCFAVILLGGWMLLHRSGFRLKKRYWCATLAGSVLLALSCLFWFLSFRTMDSGIAATILFLYPLMVAAIMVVGYRERLSRSLVGGMLLGVAGVVVLCKTGGRVNFSGICFVALSALTYAIYIVSVKQSRLRELPADLLTFHVMLGALPMYLVPLRGGLDLQLLPSWRALGNAVGLGFFPALLAFLLLAVAVREVGPTRAALLGALEPITAVAIGVMVFHEPMTWRLLLGIGLVLGSVALVVSGRNAVSSEGNET